MSLAALSQGGVQKFFEGGLKFFFVWTGVWVFFLKNHSKFKKIPKEEGFEPEPPTHQKGKLRGVSRSFSREGFEMFL